MRTFEPFVKSGYGPLDPKVNLQPDFLAGFEPSQRKEIVLREAEFYHKLTRPYSVDTTIYKEYTSFSAADGEKIDVKVYRPAHTDKVLPAVVFFHGGAFITCSIETHDYVPSYLAAHAQMTVFSIGYRLAPEYKFPVGLQDCYTALEWIQHNADKWKIDPLKINVCGDSSGGNFAAVVCLMARDQSDVHIHKQVLIYPVTDLTTEVEKQSVKIYGTPSGNDSVKGIDYIGHYLKCVDDRKNPYISPIFAKDFSNLPEALFIQAECDTLCDDGLIYAKLLQNAGVPVDVRIYKGMPHAFILRTYSQTFEALNHICSFLAD
ncbi:MAG: alpha/beta hydrolase [Treponema sp.]